MIKFDASKMEDVNADYSIFNPTIVQINIIYDMADKATNYLDLEEETCRLIIIKSHIETQQQLSVYICQIDEAPSQIRIKYSQAFREILERNLLDLAIIDNNQETVKSDLDKLFKYYASSYAGR